MVLTHFCPEVPHWLQHSVNISKGSRNLLKQQQRTSMWRWEMWHTTVLFPFHFIQSFSLLLPLPHPPSSSHFLTPLKGYKNKRWGKVILPTWKAEFSRPATCYSYLASLSFVFCQLVCLSGQCCSQEKYKNINLMGVKLRGRLCLC